MKHQAQCFRKQDVNRIYNLIWINRSESVGDLRCFQVWLLRNCIPVICYLHTREHELTHKIKQPTYNVAHICVSFTYACVSVLFGNGKLSTWCWWRRFATFSCKFRFYFFRRFVRISTAKRIKFHQSESEHFWKYQNICTMIQKNTQLFRSQ